MFLIRKRAIQIVTAGTAILGDDYTIGGTGDNQVVTLPMGSTSVETILVVVNDDTLVEPVETIILTLDAHDDRIIDDTDLVDRDPLTLTIADNDVLNASLEVMGEAILPEEGGRVTLRVTLDNVFYQATTIQIVTTGTATLDTATLGEDYTIDVNPVMLSAGSTYVETTLVVINDTLVEPDETIILTLVANNKQIIIDDVSSARITLTIADNDVPAISFDPSDYDISEGTTGKVTLRADQLPLVETKIRLTTFVGNNDIE